ncbi:hypothetical protein L9F63_017135 [Diploptera punctata]|uniref:MD-2-related lipid-recognition domain-containing protein n=1 Tax=Diploptera punctata TaxID=6984 RepID=A0AAD8EGU2_DIPPU|nr:hypothetical protein L9F63_017135 [Diploptera punctata]
MSTSFFLLLLATAALAEVVQFEDCPQESDDETAPSGTCTIQEVRISPCAEAAENKPCKIKKGNSASIGFDFTASQNSDVLTGRAYWANVVGDLPFAGMNTNACNYTTCPVQANQRQTYLYQLQIQKKFPVRAYDVKWKLWNEETSLFQCCFITKIKLVK